MNLFYWSVRSFSRKGGDGVKGVDGWYHYFSQLRVSLNENLLQHPCNNISITSIPQLTNTFSYIYRLTIRISRDGNRLKYGFKRLLLNLYPKCNLHKQNLMYDFSVSVLKNLKKQSSEEMHIFKIYFQKSPA